MTCSAAYFTAVAFIAAIVGQHCVRKLIAWLGRASLIIFVLASMNLISTLILGIAISHIFLSSAHCKVTGNSRRRSRHFQHSSQDGAASVHGVRKPLQGVAS
ncbi:hypothetical protein U9M48_014156 [Paspalum notatum var. saurae]|uniref:Uncharacterized protein n=1 Tax=Paspalum notatum var. saurae TaxID=547442 RepID=A0AAQ3WK75_PASNO